MTQHQHNLKKTNLYYVLVVILCILPVILGAILINDLFMKKSATTNPASGPQLIESQTNTPNRTGDVLQVPPPNASPAEQQAYVTLVMNNARQTEKVVLRNCTPDPIVAKIPKNGKIIIDNPDNVDQMIVFNPETTFTIPKNSQTEITVPFPKETKILGYGCDGSPNGVGLFVAP
jgi:hypothetical protein